jgi:hypothetical protein
MSASSTITLGRLYLAVTLLLLALILWQGISMIRTQRQTEEIRGQISSLQKKEKTPPPTQPEATPQPPLLNPHTTPTPPPDPLAYITKKGLFAPAPPPPMLPECTGILGDRTIINNQFKKVGEEIDGWKVERIGTESVTLRRNEDVAELQLAKRTTWPVPPPPPMPACTGIFGDTALLNNELHRVGEKVGDWEVTQITLDKVFLRNKEGNTHELPCSSRPNGPKPSPPGGTTHRQPATNPHAGTESGGTTASTGQIGTAAPTTGRQPTWQASQAMKVFSPRRERQKREKSGRKIEHGRKKRQI